MEYKIQSFCDLNAWKEGHGLVLEIYNITKFFPKEELYGITSQMRRCVVSITSNIAEGFKKRTLKDKINFYNEQHRQALARLEVITDSAQRLGFVVIAILILTSIAISFNTLRLAAGNFNNRAKQIVKKHYSKIAGKRLLQLGLRNRVILIKGYFMIKYPHAQESIFN